MFRRWLAVVGLCAWVLSASQLRAQETTLRGTLTGPTGTPVSGAAVYVLDARGIQVRAVLSDGAGRFRADLAGPGAYRLRIERIGFETEEIAELVVSPSEEERIITLRVRPLELDPLAVTAERVCHAEASRNPELLRLWSEARKALAQTALSAQDSSRVFQVEVSERTLDPELEVQSATADTLALSGAHAFIFQPVERLGSTGWGEREDDRVTTLFGPSPDAFLSARFGATHCLSLAEDARPESRVGVAFESIPDSLEVGLKGTFWLDPSSWRLRRIDFRYTGTPELEDARHQGGTVILDVSDEGQWYAAAWSVVGPVLDASGARYTRAADNVLMRTQAYRVQGYLEHAGRVLAPREVPATLTSPWASPEALARVGPDPATQTAAAVAQAIRAACPAPERDAALAVMAGTVTDSVSAVPLARARVRIEWQTDPSAPPLALETRTDERGYYQFCEAPGGATVTLAATLGGASVRTTVLLEPSTLHIERLQLPLSDPARPGVLLGRVIDAETRSPVANASITLEEIDGARTLTNPRGYFSLGEQPWGVYRLSVSAFGYADRQEAIRIQGGVSQTVDIELAAEPIAIEGLAVSVRGREDISGMEDMIRRMRLGLGNFITRDVIERRPGARVADLLREAPGTRVYISGPDVAYLEVRGKMCVPDVFVDGIPWITDAATALTSLYGMELEAIEVYKGISETPAEFIRSGPAPCAVVVIWTR